MTIKALLPAFQRWYNEQRLHSSVGYRTPRAIALCGSRIGLAEEQAQPVIIVEGGPEFAATDAVTRRAMMTQDIQGHATDQGQVFGGMVLAGPASILAKLHIQHPMLGVLNGSMATDRGDKPRWVRERA